MKTNIIYNNDCLEVLKTLPNNSIDCIVTDPPYGYSFMGKDWDKVVPPIEVWKECLRVLKDGSFCFVMSAPRQDVLSQMIIRLSEAGLDTGFTSIYWTYASGFPKALNIGKKTKKENLSGSYGGFQPKPAVEIIIVCMKPLSEKTYVEQALKNGKGITWLDNCRIPFQSNQDLENRKRGTLKTNPLGRSGIYSEMKTVNTDEYISDKGRFPANLLVSDDILNNGKITKASPTKRHRTHRSESFGMPNNETFEYGDEGSFSRYFDLDKWWIKKIEELPEEIKKTCPFIITPKASKGERNKGLEELEDGYVTEQNKWSENDYRKGKGEKTSIVKKNIHPTVKPLKLMSYLITLGSREGDIILDPYVGSGTTCLASKILNRQYIGIELMSEYCEIAKARIGTEIVRIDKVSNNETKEVIVRVQEDSCSNCKWKKHCKKHLLVGKCNMYDKD